MLVKGLVNTSRPKTGYYMAGLWDNYPADDRSSYILCNSCAIYYHETLEGMQARPPHGLDVTEVVEFPESKERIEKSGSVVEFLQLGDTKLVLRFKVE